MGGLERIRVQRGIWCVTVSAVLTVNTVAQRVLSRQMEAWNGRFLQGVYSVPDVDGDGRNDLWMVYLNQARIISSATLIPTGAQAIDTSIPNAAMVPAVDLDQDGVVDAVIGNGQGTGVRYYSMRTGAFLYERPNPTGIIMSSASSRVLGDLNGDGHDEFALTTGFMDVFLFRGIDGQFFRFHGVGASGVSGGWQSSAVPFHDVDGDGVIDYALADAVASVLVVISGRTGAAVGDFQGGVLPPPYAPGQPEGFGRTVDCVGDVDLDGVPELVVGCHNRVPILASGAPTLDFGRTKLISGRTGQVVWMTEGASWAAQPAQLGGAFGSSGGDVDGDGAHDILHYPSNDAAIVRSSRTGEVLWRGMVRDPQDPLFGVGFRRILPDIDGDGYDDFYGLEHSNLVLLAGGPVSIDRAFCPGSMNGLGREAVLDWRGPLAVERTYQDIALTDGFPGALALLFAAPRGGAPAALAPLCLASPAQRLGAPRVLDVAGNLVQRLDWGAPWSQVFQPWADIEVQAIYRDPLGSASFAVSNALRVHLSP